MKSTRNLLAGIVITVLLHFLLLIVTQGKADLLGSVITGMVQIIGSLL